MSEVIARLQHEFEVGGVKYMISAMPAFLGLSVRQKLLAGNGGDPLFIQKLILDNVTVDGMKKDEAWFNNQFARSYTDLDEVMKEILEFNFPELVGKLDGSPE